MGGITSKIHIKTVNKEGIIYNTDSDGDITNNLLPSEMIEKEYLKRNNTTRKLGRYQKTIKIFDYYQNTIDRLKHYKTKEIETGIAS